MPASILNSFAYFCLVDNEPRVQRKILFAINQRHTLVLQKNSGSNKVYQDFSKHWLLMSLEKQELRNPSKRGNSLGGFGGKLNSLLRARKQKRTRAGGLYLINFIGIFHALSMSIHDHRLQEGSSMLEILSEATLQKKRTGETNKALLHAMCNRMQGLAIGILEKGYPKSPSNPIFMPHENFSFTFPSYFHLAVSLNLVDVARTMIKVIRTAF